MVSLSDVKKPGNRRQIGSGARLERVGTGLFLDTPGVTIRTGELRIRSIDVDKILTRGADLLKRFTAPLRQDQMARLTVTRFD